MKALKKIKLVFEDDTEQEIQDSRHVIIATYGDDNKGFYSRRASDLEDFCELVGNIIKQGIEEDYGKNKNRILSLMLLVLSKLK